MGQVRASTVTLSRPVCSPIQSLHAQPCVCLLRLSLLVQCDQSGKDGEALSSWEWESKAGHI